MSNKQQSRPRTTYRHGNLKQALLDAALDLAREHGPDGIVLREATRRAGVAFSAAYRHYEGQRDLLDAVRAAALAQVARSMETEMSALGPFDSSPEYARNSLRAIGRAYIRFALDEPGLFRTAFVIPFSLDEDTLPLVQADMGLNPFQLLGMALDRMQAAGLLSAAQRPQAEFLAWSGVHGMAMLMLDGPLRDYPEAQLKNLSQRLLLMVEQGLQDGRDADLG
ncbi:TetR/AcrR family transcriptional regulator [Paenalcaligenes niemegkensis]|uniref:TetR-like C-terminal domain-containing protein n=1 Tax=Paenalcaligenes niemegkensis TaxID=2895469 RepID=UPI001EE860BF|nr:TetR/AcrR family transcriptional regulator [Paenalcaligenes niemegkensis]MCQ9618008.1 TetR/AcrR family transcriptional regulator [Paenalcaligenes niemegkensis]